MEKEKHFSEKERKKKVLNNLMLKYFIITFVRYSDTMVMSVAEISKHSGIECI